MACGDHRRLRRESQRLSGFVARKSPRACHRDPGGGRVVPGRQYDLTAGRRVMLTTSAVEGRVTQAAMAAAMSAGCSNSSGW